MRICIPIEKDEGLKSKVSNHFGGAPFLLVYDTDAQDFHVVSNTSAHHSHGMCHPLDVLQGCQVDAVICRGMGARAVRKLLDAGVKAYTADGKTVEALIAQHKQGVLKEITVENACTEHTCSQ
jgi:predicted Fe-Mo cluster-binding NifX family protein